MGNFSLFKNIRPAVVTAIKYTNGKTSGTFSGYVSVKMLDTHDDIDYVKWTNPLMGNTGYGVVTIPVPNKDCVVVGFDFRKTPYVVGMLTFNQAAKSIGDDGKQGPDENLDPRLNIQPGELMLRGTNKSSILFGNDGSTVFRLDDTKKDTDTSNLVIKIDANQNITITNAKDVNMQCQSAKVTATNNVDVNAVQASVKADKVIIDSEDINLGIGGSPILRVSDVAGMSVLGTPGAVPLPVVLTGPGSLTTKSK